MIVFESVEIDAFIKKIKADKSKLLTKKKTWKETPPESQMSNKMIVLTR